MHNEKLTNAMKNSSTSESRVTNVSLISVPERGQQLHDALAMPSHTGRMLAIVGRVGQGDGLEGWRHSASSWCLRASSTADGSMRELQVTDCLNDTESYDVFDRVPET